MVKADQIDNNDIAAENEKKRKGDNQKQDNDAVECIITYPK